MSTTSINSKLNSPQAIQASIPLLALEQAQESLLQIRELHRTYENLEDPLICAKFHKTCDDIALKLLENIKFIGDCRTYAFGKILKTYIAPQGTLIREGNNDDVFKKYFAVTTEPQVGDLAAYYQLPRWPLHYGICCSKGLIESKWGAGPIYRHPPFYVPNEYGDYIIYYRLRPDLTPETLLKNLQQDFKDRK